MVVTIAYLVFESLVISPTQALDRDLGIYGGSIGFGTPAIEPGTQGLDRIVDGLERAGFSDVFASLTVMDVHLNGSRVDVREGDWSTEPYPARYRLEQGEWADEPGEATVAARDPSFGPQVGDEVQLLSGRMELTVVGVAANPFAGEVTTYLIGSGTWATVPPSTSLIFPGVQAMPVVLWDGKRMPEMVDAFAIAHPQRDSLDHALVRHSVFRASDVIDDTRDDAADRGNPYGYAIPSIGLPLLGAVVWLGLLWRRLIGHHRQLVDLGMPPRVAAWVSLTSTVPALCLALVTGVGAGAAVAAATRPALAAWHGEPLSPIKWPWDPVARCGLVALVSVLAAFVGLALRRRAKPSPRLRVSGLYVRRANAWKTAREARRWVAVLAFVAVIGLLPTASSVTSAMLLALACVALGAALAPDVLVGLVRILPREDFRIRLSGRQLVSSPPASVGTSVIAGTIGSAIAFSILLSTLIATMDERQTPEVLPGQVIIHTSDGGLHNRSSPEALRVLESLELPEQVESVQLQFLSPQDRNRPRVVLEHDDEYVMAVDSVAQAEALLGEAWDQRFDRVLRSGGLVRWFNRAEGEEAQFGGSAVVLTFEGQRTPLATLDTINADWPRVNWARGVGGITLSSTAQGRHLPLSDGEVILTGAPESLASRIRATLRDNGLDEDLASGYERPPAPIPPTGLVATAGLLGVMTMLLIMISAAGRVAELRPVLGVLLANGVPPKWIRHCILFQEATVMLVGLLVGVVVGAVPILAAVPRFDGYWVVTLPLREIAILLAACVFGTTVAAFLSVRGLRPEVHNNAVFSTT